MSDYTSALAKFRHDLATNCQDADDDAGVLGSEGIVSAEENVINALESNTGKITDPSLVTEIQNEITKATAAVNQVIDQANVINDQANANANASQNDTITPCNLGTWPTFTPVSS